MFLPFYADFPAASFTVRLVGYKINCILGRKKRAVVFFCKEENSVGPDSGPVEIED